MASQENPVSAPVLTKSEFEFDEAPIGRGGFGTVYRAKHKDFGIVAVKTLIDNGMLPQKHIRILTKEAKKLGQLCGHPSILKLLGTIMEKDNYSLILEYMALGSLVEFRKEFKVQWPVMSRIVTDIASGMEYLHSHDPHILHLDLKGDNILLNGQIRAKIADFGLSEWRTITMTVTRGTGGEAGDGRRCTVSHVPPEVWSNINLPSSTHFDIYGFGIVLWEMLSGQVPYRGVSDELVRSAVLSGQRPDFVQIPKDASPKFTQLMTRCWHQKPGQRPPFTVIKKEVDTLYKDVYEKDIVKALKNIRSEIVADYEHDDPVYTQTADIDNMQIPVFTVPKVPEQPLQQVTVSTDTEMPSSSHQSTSQEDSQRETSIPMETETAEDDTPVDVKYFKVEEELDTNEKMMRKILHNPIAMRLVHTPYAKEVFRLNDKAVKDLRDPKKVERVIQSDLTLQWEMKFSKFDYRRDLSGMHAKRFELTNVLYDKINEDELKGTGRTYRHSCSRFETAGQRLRDRRRSRVDETMNKNPHVGGYDSKDTANYFRLKKALDNPAQLRQAMRDRESGKTESSLTTIEKDIFDLMKDPYLLIAVLYQESGILLKLSNNYPDMFLKILQGLNGYSSYTNCENQNHNWRMLDMMRHIDRDKIRSPEDLMRMMEMAGPRMRKMRHHPMYDMDDDDEHMDMMMREMMMGRGMRPDRMEDMRMNMMPPMYRMEMERRRREMNPSSRKESEPSSSSASGSSKNESSQSSGIIGNVLSQVKNLLPGAGRNARDDDENKGNRVLQEKDNKHKEIKMESDELDQDGPRSNSLETDAAPPPERVQGTSDIIPAAVALPVDRQSTTPILPQPQGSSLSHPGDSVSSHPGVVTSTSLPASAASVPSIGNNISSLGSASAASVTTPMEVDPFPSLMPLDDSSSVNSRSLETPLKQLYNPPTPKAASLPSTSKLIQQVQNVNVSATKTSGSRSAMETQSLDQDVSIDANPSMETIATTKSEIYLKDDGKTHTIYHNRPGCTTKIVLSGNKEAKHPNIQVGDKNVMVINKGEVSGMSAKPQVPAKLTKSKRPVTPDDFDVVSEKIGSSVHELAKRLDITPANMDQIQLDYGSEGSYEVCYQMLKKWSSSKRQATIDVLAKALSKIKRNDIANQLQ